MKHYNTGDNFSISLQSLISTTQLTSNLLNLPCGQDKKLTDVLDIKSIVNGQIKGYNFVQIQGVCKTDFSIKIKTYE